MKCLRENSFTMRTAMLCDAQPRVTLQPPTPHPRLTPLLHHGTQTPSPSARPAEPASPAAGELGAGADVRRGCRGSEGPRPCRPPFLPPPWPGTPGIWAAGALAAAGPLFWLASGSRLCPPLRSPASPARCHPPLPLFIFFGGGGGWVGACGGLGRLRLCVWCGPGALGPFLSDAGGMQLIQWAAV